MKPVAILAQERKIPFFCHALALSRLAFILWLFCMAAQVNYSRLLLNFLFIVVAVCSPLLVFLGAYAVLISDSGSISALASRTATPWLAEPPIANAEALAASSEVIDYVRGGPEIARKSYFREEELSHLSDVRRVILKSFLLLKILAA